MARLPVPLRKPVVQPPPSDDLGMGVMRKAFRQFGSDASAARQQVHSAVQAVQSGFQKVKDFLSK